MKRYGIALILFALLLMAGGRTGRPAEAQNTAEPITPENAADVIELTRFGRGIAYGSTWSPDGSQLLVYGAAGVWLFDLSDLSAPPIYLDAFSREVRSAAFSADGTLIVAGSDHSDVRVWDLTAGKTMLNLGIDGNWGTSRAAISPDGTQIVLSIGRDIRLHNAITGDLLVELEDAHTSTIVGLVFSPDGSLILSGSADNTARLWDAETLEELAVLEGHSRYVNDVAFSPDGTQVVTVSSDKSVRLWNTVTGEEVASFMLERGSILCVSYTADGTRIVIGSAYGAIHLLDAATLAEVALWEGAHPGDVIDVAFSPDGSRLTSISDDQTIKLWDMADGSELNTIPGYTQEISNLAVNASDNRILAGSIDGILRIWDLTGDDAHPVFLAEDGVSSHTANLDIAHFSPDGSRFAGIHGTTLRVWDATSHALLFEAEDYTFGSFRSLSFSPNSLVLAVTTDLAYVLLWDATTGELLNALTGHGDSVTPVLFNEDGSLLVTGGRDGTVRVWGLPETKEAQDLD